MLTPKQVKIFEAFIRRPYAELTYKNIKEYSKEKSNSIIQKAIIAFLRDELILKQEVGNIILYKLNLDNSLVFSYFDIILKEKQSNLLKKTLKIIREETSSMMFVSVVIFGSYAEGKQKDKSDLDIALFVNSLEDKKRCELAMKTAELKSLIPIDVHIITQTEMLAMLKDKHENLGKQIAYKHLVIQNPTIFYSIIEEGINNGFKIIYT